MTKNGLDGSTIPPASNAAMLKFLSIAGYLAMMGGLLGLWFTRQVLSASLLVITPQALAVALMLWARVTFGRRSFHAVANPTAGGLVTNGPYRLIRHPIYTAVCLFTWSGVLSHWSWSSALLGFVVLAGALVRLFIEEPMVSKQYPEYRAYSSRTWRMIPFVF